MVSLGFGHTEDISFTQLRQLEAAEVTVSVRRAGLQPRPLTLELLYCCRPKRFRPGVYLPNKPPC